MNNGYLINMPLGDLRMGLVTFSVLQLMLHPMRIP